MAAKIAGGVVALILKVANVLTHSIGLYLLRSLPAEGRETPQMAYILNLSITELVINILSFVRNLLKMLPYKFKDSATFKEVVLYSYFIDYAILKFSLYTTMVYVTLDRLLKISVNISYPLYWSYMKTRRLLTCTWIASVVLITVSIIYYETTGDSKDLLLISNYVIISLDFSFVVIAIASYCLMFRKFEQGQRFRRTMRGSRQRTYRSKFHVAFLLIVTFTIFIVPADLAWTFSDPKHITIPVQQVLSILYAISYLSDGLIYIFGQHRVKKLFWTKFGRCQPKLRSSTLSVYVIDNNNSASTLPNSPAIGNNLV